MSDGRGEEEEETEGARRKKMQGVEEDEHKEGRRKLQHSWQGEEKSVNQGWFGGKSPKYKQFSNN